MKSVENVEQQMAEFLDEIVANVKRERRKRGISQLALAGILGHKSPNYIAKTKPASKAQTTTYTIFSSSLMNLT